MRTERDRVGTHRKTTADRELLHLSRDERNPQRLTIDVTMMVCISYKDRGQKTLRDSATRTHVVYDVPGTLVVEGKDDCGGDDVSPDQRLFPGNRLTFVESIPLVAIAVLDLAAVSRVCVAGSL